MKAVKFLMLVVLISSIAFTSCKKDENTGDPSIGDGSMTLKYAGTSWDASLAVQAVNTNGVINVTGSDSQGKQAAITLFGVDSPGTYEITSGSQHSGRWTEGVDPSETYVANGIIGTGTITITELSETKIKGSFSFEGFNTTQTSKSITEGSFDVNF